MKQALTIARHALNNDEFPVGCVIVYKDKVIAQGERINTNQNMASELDHAEMIALRRLEELSHPGDRAEMTIYATLEPCLMCFGAILISRIGTLVYAYEDAMGGGVSCDRKKLPRLYGYNDIEIVPNVCREESLQLFQDFFSRPHIDYWRDSYLATYTLSQQIE